MLRRSARPAWLLVCSLALSACSLADSGPSEITGRVVDADTGEPVEARVQIGRNVVGARESEASVVTGPDGRFSLETPSAPVLTSTFLRIYPTATVRYPSYAVDSRLYSWASVSNVQNLDSGDLGDIEVAPRALLVVDLSRDLAPGETVEYTAAWTPPDDSVQTERRRILRSGAPSSGVRLVESVRAGTLVAVAYEVRAPNGSLVTEARIDAVTATGREFRVEIDLDAR